MLCCEIMCLDKQTGLMVLICAFRAFGISHDDLFLDKKERKQV